MPTDVCSGLSSTSSESVCQSLFFRLHGIGRDAGNIFCRDQVIERRRSGLLVESVILDRGPHNEKVLLERGLSSVLHGPVVTLSRDGRQDHDDRDDDHQFRHASVKPAARIPRRPRREFSVIENGLNRISLSPAGIFRSIARSSRRLRVHVEDVASAPAIGIRIVAHGAQAPVGFSSQGIHRDFP